jgi:hypothetical protein
LQKLRIVAGELSVFPSRDSARHELLAWLLAEIWEVGRCQAHPPVPIDLSRGESLSGSIQDFAAVIDKDPLVGGIRLPSASPLHELTGFCLAVDCLAPGCGRERTYAVAELASFYGRERTVGEVLRRMRCSGGCGGRVGAAWLITGPVLNMRVRPRRVALLGAEARG